MKKIYSVLSLFTTISILFFSCSKNDDSKDFPKATLSNIEIGLGNNEMGVIGRDFHFNADILAGNKIDSVILRILPRTDESYSKEWSFQIIWTEFKGVRNANVHKHFNIPADAVEGKYDFVIIIKDENGTVLEEKYNIHIYAPENLPVDLRFELGIDAVDVDFNFIRAIYARRNIYDDESYQSTESINKNEFLSPIVNIAAVKGDGKMYCLIINKKHNYRPETIAAIDFSKVIVADVWEHRALSQSQFVSNMYDFSTTPLSFFFPSIEIGAVNDNNIPASNAINGLKTWESGNYYVGFIYHNSSHNMTVFHYGEISINLN